MVSSFISGYKISEAGCEKQISPDVPDVSPVIPNAKTVLFVFEEMGYEPDTAVNTLPVAPLVNNKQAFRDLRKQPDIQQRLFKVLASNTNLLLEDYEQLLDMAAHVSDDIKWCKKIRPGIRHPREKPDEKHWDKDYRQTCIFEVALNSRNLAYCDELPEEADSSKPQWNHLANNCRHYVKQYQKKEYSKRPYFYSYHVPDHQGQQQRIFHFLEYAVPKDSDQPQVMIARRYRHLLNDIGHGRVYRDDERIQTLLKKLRNLERVEESSND